MSTKTHDLKTADGMQQFLSETLYPNLSQSLQLLSGGSSKFIYRVPEPTGESSDSVIAIHAALHNTAGDFALWQDRLRTEFNVYSYLGLNSPGFPKSTIKTDKVSLTATVPTAYRHFPDEAVMIVEDVPCAITLKSALIEHKMSTETAETIGLAIGQFASDLHTWGASNDPAAVKLRAELGECKEAKDVSFTVFYHWLEKTANEVETGTIATEEMKELIQKVKSVMKEEMFEKRENWTVLHGDFWTGNVLVPEAYVVSDKSEKVGEIVERKLHIVDWELCKFASRHFDLGQMLAEMYLPFHFYGNEASLAMIDAFIATYTRLSLYDKTEEQLLDVVFKTMMHFGGHLAVWPRLTGWPAENGKVDSCIEFGAECIRKGWEKDVEFLKSGIFKGFAVNL